MALILPNCPEVPHKSSWSHIVGISYNEWLASSTYWSLWLQKIMFCKYYTETKRDIIIWFYVLWAITSNLLKGQFSKPVSSLVASPPETRVTFGESVGRLLPAELSWSFGKMVRGRREEGGGTDRNIIVNSTFIPSIFAGIQRRLHWCSPWFCGLLLTVKNLGRVFCSVLLGVKLVV